MAEVLKSGRRMVARPGGLTRELVPPSWVVWCGVVWHGLVWCGVVWHGIVWCGVVLCGVMLFNGAPEEERRHSTELCEAAGHHLPLPALQPQVLPPRPHLGGIL